MKGVEQVEEDELDPVDQEALQKLEDPNVRIKYIVFIIRGICSRAVTLRAPL